MTDNFDHEPIFDVPVLLDKPKSLPIGMGLRFWQDALLIFKQDMLSWLLCGLVSVGVLFVLPLLLDWLFTTDGANANGAYDIFGMICSVFGLILNVGFAYKAHLQVCEQDNSVSDIFAPFRINLMRQIGLYFVLILLALGLMSVVVLLFFANMAVADGFIASGGSLLLIVLYFLVLLIAAIPIMMAMWFSPILIVFHDLSIIRAVALSFRACLANILPFLCYGILWLVLAIVASMPLFLGWFVFLPIMALTYYTAYRHILTE